MPAIAADPFGPRNESLRRYLVCGANPLSYRLIEELRQQYDGRVTVILPATRTLWANRIGQLDGITIVEADRLDADAFERAGLGHMDALALADQDDAGNIDAALIAQELCPDLRIVVRMFNQSLGARITELLNNCAVLSAAAIAAPAFVASALDEPAGPPVHIGDQILSATRTDNGRPEHVVAGLAVLGPTGTEPELLPADADDRADLVLAVAASPRPTRPRRSRTHLRLLPIIFGRRLRLILSGFLAAFALGTAALAVIDRRSWPDAAYTSLLAELSGNADQQANGADRIVLTLLVLVSVILIPTITAALVDALVKARLRLTSGTPLDPRTGHVVVVGLGDVGTRVAMALHEAGVDVVAIDRDPQARGVGTAREAGLAVVVGDASRPETLTAAFTAGCRALVITSSDDVANLETALLGRSLAANLRVVLRLFDAEFADRVKRAFHINISRSVSYLAAPAFAAAMLGRQIIATIPARRHVLLVAELPVAAGSTVEHRPVSDLNRAHTSRLLAVRTGDGAQVLWRPSGGRPVRRTDRLVVVATRTGLSQLLAATSAPAEIADPTAFGLLQPWQLPQRPAPADPPS